MLLLDNVGDVRDTHGDVLDPPGEFASEHVADDSRLWVVAISIKSSSSADRIIVGDVQLNKLFSTINI